MKNFLFILFLPVVIFCQENTVSINDTVIAFLDYGNTTYLQTNKGIIKLDVNKVWEKYYRKIYNDSTIVNPNTIISVPQQYIPIISIDMKTNRFNNLKKRFPLKDLVNKIDGNIYILPSVLDSLKKK